MAEHTPLVSNLVRFGRCLRALGLSVTPQTEADLLEAVAVVGMERERDFYWALRAVCVSRPEEIPVFDQAYRSFFEAGAEVPLPSRLDRDLLEVSELGPVSPVLLLAGGHRHLEGAERAGWSPSERLGHRDFADLSPEEVVEVRRIIALLHWEVPRARSRRLEPARRAGRPDLRRTFRRLTGPEGPLMPLALQFHRERRRPLLVLADVSGSMERYTEMILHFVHGARGRLGRVEAFVFSTRLTRITREMQRSDPNQALAEVSRKVEDWSGGTRIGEALRAFNLEWSRRVTGGGPVAMVVSDGWDRGDPEVLRQEMARFSRSVHRLVWLNPLAGREGYRPEAGGMGIVLPFVDDFLPAATLADLRDVVQLLESVPESRRKVVRG